MMLTDEQKHIVTVVTIKLAQLGLEASFVEPITTGPLITTYRFAPKSATKVTQIVNTAQDLALALGVEDVLVRRLPGESVIGISVPNKTRTTVQWRDCLAAPPDDFMIPLNLGVDSQGRIFRDDLTKCPHLLIAGSTGNGKSVLLNSMISSLMYWRTPAQIQFALSDTKSGEGLEFNCYKGSPYLIRDIATTKYATWELMDWLVEETDHRLTTIGRSHHKNIADYNKTLPAQPLGYIVLIIDELADIMEGEKRGEGKISQSKLGKIVQKARAAGIHVIAATQRPSVDVIAVTVKNNFPARLSFRLTSGVDSRTVLSTEGAEHILQQGDMLYYGPAATALKRLHSAWAATKDLNEMLMLTSLRAR